MNCSNGQKNGGINMQNFMITLLTCSALMSSLGLCYMAVTPLLEKRYSTKGRYYAWLMIVVGLIIPFRPQFQSSIIKITPTNTITPVIQIGNKAPIISPIEHTVLHATPPSLSISLWQVVALIWIVGVVGAWGYYFIKHYRFLTMVKRWSEPITNQQALSLLQNLKKELGISKEIAFQQCLCIGSPMLVGFIHPCILLPKTDFEGEGLYFILKHELVHYRRKDLWYKLLVLIATALHWFNPIVYLIASSIEGLCEMSCDEEVVRSTDADKRQYYSEAILNVARYHCELKTKLSTNFYGGKKNMKKRILSIMDISKKRAGIVVVCVIALLTLGTGTAFVVNATSEPASNYRCPLTVTSTTNAGDTILNYQLECLAYDKDGKPLELDWDWDTLVTTNDGFEGGIDIGNTPNSSKAYQFIYMGNSPSMWDDIFLYKAIEMDEDIRELAMDMKQYSWISIDGIQNNGYILFDKWNQSISEDDGNYIIYCIKSVTFEDETVWENPEYDKWVSDYEGKNVDPEILSL